MKKICIRVDGNEIIATGHIMRCLSIAHQLKKQGAEVIFVMADAQASFIIRENGFDYYTLNTIWNDMNAETEIFCRYLKDNNIETVLVDSYYVTGEYLSAIARISKVSYIDDIDKLIYPVHTVINYGLQCDRGYEARYADAGYNTKFLLGGMYAPLREEFSYAHYEVKKNIKKVLITTGGTDQLNMSYRLSKSLVSDVRLKDLEYHIIVGKFNKNVELLRDLARDNSNILLHENVTNMSYWMRNCDVALSAAGTTTFELAACGIPSICFEVADNQAGAGMWEQAGYMLYAGNAYMEQEKCIENCSNFLYKLSKNYDERKRLSEKMQNLTDGLGAYRIAEHLLE